MYVNRKTLFSLTLVSLSLLFFSITLEVYGENKKVFEAQIIFEKPGDFTKYRDNLHSEVFDLKLLTNNNTLCPTGNCKFRFIDDDYINGLRYQNNEQLSLTGTLEVYTINNNNSSFDTITDSPSNVYGLHGIFQLLNGITTNNTENNELVNESKRIEGTLNIGKKVFSAPEFEYDINGELKDRNNDIVLKLSAFQ